MRVRIILILTALLVACFTAAAWSSSLITQPLSRPRPAQNRSVTGRISSIGDASFSVEVKKSQDLITVKFLIDDETKIVGRLEVGSAATVDYHTDGGNNIASHIVVRSAFHSH